MKSRPAKRGAALCFHPPNRLHAMAEAMPPRHRGATVGRPRIRSPDLAESVKGPSKSPNHSNLDRQGCSAPPLPSAGLSRAPPGHAIDRCSPDPDLRHPTVTLDRAGAPSGCGACGLDGITAVGNANVRAVSRVL